MAAIAGIGAAVLAAAPAQADPLPQFAPFGATLFNFGDANFCAGAVSIALEAAPQRPGFVRAHVRSLGYQRGPCGNQVSLGWVGSAGARHHNLYVRAAAGPGQVVTADLFIGMGPAKIMAASWPMQGTFAEWYLYVP
ncbi:hypothetical protein ACFVMC_14010 [Nocardia sp. NPDC127579]|uniref:hypothetical protein n=1 Tax=Nocardia sp. NPDC127579 TaxID=3345402 RepID=UPI00362C0071